MESGSTVCIVDDDESVRESLTGLLRSFGFNARPFESVEDFLAMRPLNAHCLILDVTMPGMKGTALQERLLLEGKPVPIVFITARTEEPLRMRLLERGAIACLFKPFASEALLRAVQEATRAQYGDDR
jgi:FixJ family two-component response regulator